MKHNIIRTVTWDRRTALCKQYGFRAAIVYAQPPGGMYNPAPACDNRLRVKDFLYQRLGKPMMKPSHWSISANWSYGEWTNTDAEWLAYRSTETEYTIAVKDPKLITWLVLL